ncbi:hypothetical protein BC936DRAFT_147257 [Jimgerdemannia flammicorona]|uniref:Uncharacterized protein n=1 Tax=Jimgerdemannia flammicorona TaxID=994334 RepID=A0A433D5S1_9FUNG|nr:hypothetical protein BC936DRAFT_147257 [Jimgerdemannia flammicorona]
MQVVRKGVPTISIVHMGVMPALVYTSSVKEMLHSNGLRSIDTPGVDPMLESVKVQGLIFFPFAVCVGWMGGWREIRMCSMNGRVRKYCRTLHRLPTRPIPSVP